MNCEEEADLKNRNRKKIKMSLKCLSKHSTVEEKK